MAYTFFMTTRGKLSTEDIARISDYDSARHGYNPEALARMFAQCQEDDAVGAPWNSALKLIPSEAHHLFSTATVHPFRVKLRFVFEGEGKLFFLEYTLSAISSAEKPTKYQIDSYILTHLSTPLTVQVSTEYPATTGSNYRVNSGSNLVSINLNPEDEDNHIYEVFASRLLAHYI